MTPHSAILRSVRLVLILATDEPIEQHPRVAPYLANRRDVRVKVASLGASGRKARTYPAVVRITWREERPAAGGAAR
ncbi:MAG TPA: hypothetical protein VD948_04965 [Rhodothermales bacterium]|nr:hypothetical protein [Rhodothermales bacterium]